MTTKREAHRCKISEIDIGSRHRKDMGDITSLAANIAELGLLHPIVVTPDLKLIAGARRLAACKELGLTAIPARVIDLDKVERGEFAENFYRKSFQLSEMVAIKRSLEPLEQAAAKQRQGTRTDKHSAKLAGSSKGDTRDKVARIVGKGRTTLNRAEEIIEAAEAEPERFGKLVTAMDRTGRVNGLYRRLQIIRQAEDIRKEPPPLPGRGPYRVIVADPPWPYQDGRDDPSHNAIAPYPEMSVAEICALDVGSLAAPDCILWLWTTNYNMRDAFAVLDAWGFYHRTILTWVKDKMGTGDWLRGQTEHVLMAGRGRPTIEITNQTTVLHAPSRKHSQKPVEFYDMVESLCPAPRYAYLFSRYRHNDKWDCHGDQAPGGGQSLNSNACVVLSTDHDLKWLRKL